MGSRLGTRVLLNLDSGTFERTVDESAPEGEKLVVFDGISKLKGKRRTNLVSLVGKLHTKHCEVMVTTEDSTLASDVELPVVVLDAREMALAHDELPSRANPSARFALPEEKPNPMPKRTMPPVVLDKEGGAKRFLQSLLANVPSSAEESLAYLALFAGSGDLVSLLEFFDEENKPDLLSVERRFPYAGIRRTASTFSAFELTNAAKHELMCAHCASIAPFTRYETEDSFNLACAELCLSLGNRSLLMMGPTIFLFGSRSLPSMAKRFLGFTSKAAKPWANGYCLAFPRLIRQRRAAMAPRLCASICSADAR